LKELALKHGPARQVEKSTKGTKYLETGGRGWPPSLLGKTWGFRILFFKTDVVGLSEKSNGWGGAIFGSVFKEKNTRCEGGNKGVT